MAFFGVESVPFAQRFRHTHGMPAGYDIGRIQSHVLERLLPKWQQPRDARILDPERFTADFRPQQTDCAHADIGKSVTTEVRFANGRKGMPMAVQQLEQLIVESRNVGIFEKPFFVILESRRHQPSPEINTERLQSTSNCAGATAVHPQNDNQLISHNSCRSSLQTTTHQTFLFAFRAACTKKTAFVGHSLLHRLMSVPLENALQLGSCSVQEKIGVSEAKGVVLFYAALGLNLSHMKENGG